MSVHTPLSARYELGHQLEDGGAAAVYEAWDNHLNRAVALKLIEEPRSRQSFESALQEARTLARLEHPGILPVYDAGRRADGSVYYTTRLFHGDALSSFFAREASLLERLRVFQRLCDTIAFAHEAGVIHRNLKPQSIRVGHFGEVIVLDWGFSEWLAPPGAEGSSLIAASPRYTAPEQAGGRSRSVDGRADVFALGVILEDLLGNEGSRPLRAIARKASAAEPLDRYQHVIDLAADISRFLDHLPVTAYDQGLIERMQQFGARHRVLLLVLATYILVRVSLFLLDR
jgi:serine/threonine protein kinase